ncbi:MAG: 50S ribosomal protein L4 [Candidatus Woesebacteria bacterium]|jgi:large subunit ribosomal protein L4
MTKLNTYSAKGVKKASVDMPPALKEDINMSLLAQAIRVYEDNKHPGLSKVKTRGEVSLSTRKIYRQKGTGLARHGAKSAPIFVGGGVVHGPDGMKKKLTLSKRMRRKALKVALNIKAEDNQLFVIDGVSALKKTKQANKVIEEIIKKEKIETDNPKFTFVLSEKNKDAFSAIRNLANVGAVEYKNLNAHEVFFGGVILLDKDTVKSIKKAGKKKIKVKKTKTKGKKKV